MVVRLVVLGSGQDGGSPQLGHATGKGPARTASSVAVVGDGSIVLLDASPDVRTQFATLAPTLQGREPRRPFDAVCITHAHMGHYAGLLHFGKEAAAVETTPLVAPPSVIDFLETHEPWRSLFADGHLLATPITSAPIEGPDMAIMAVPVPHRADFSTTVAYSIAIGGEAWALYLPDIDAWDPWEEAEATIAAHRISLLDATFGSPDEVQGRDLSDIPHPVVRDTIERFGHLTRGRRIILTHMNHTNDLADPASDLAAAARAAGFEIAFDGMVVDRVDAPSGGTADDG